MTSRRQRHIGAVGTGADMGAITVVMDMAGATPATGAMDGATPVTASVTGRTVVTTVTGTEVMVDTAGGRTFRRSIIMPVLILRFTVRNASN